MQKDSFGFSRVKDATPATPQAAEKLDASLPIRASEVLLRVELLNLDSTSARDLARRYGNVASAVLRVVKSRGKMHNPHTDSGGVLVGVVEEVGEEQEKGGLKKGDRIIPLCSMTAIPLSVSSIDRVVGEQVYVNDGYAILYESLQWTRVPPDLPLPLVLAAVDVSRLVPQLETICTTFLGGDNTKFPGAGSVLLVGCGRSALVAMVRLRELCPKVHIVGCDIDAANLDRATRLLEGLGEKRLDPAPSKASPPQPPSAFPTTFFPTTTLVQANAKDAQALYQISRTYCGLEGADVVLNLVNVTGTESGCSLAASKCICYFSMATNFARACLSTDITGKPLAVWIGAGVYADQADLTLDLLRRYPALKLAIQETTDHHQDNVTSQNTSSTSSLYPLTPSGYQATQIYSFAVQHCGFDGHLLPIELYKLLHKWSCSEPEQFWKKLWEFVEIPTHRPFDKVLEKTGPLFHHVRWFPGAQLNHAEILLRRALDPEIQDKPALICLTEMDLQNNNSDGNNNRNGNCHDFAENSVGSTLSYSQLYRCVARAQHGLYHRLGLQKGDIVAALLFNGAEAIITMLACTAIGATFSSLSPDLGIDVLFSRFSQINPKVLVVSPTYMYNGKIFSCMDRVRQLVQSIKSIKTVIVVENNNINENKRDEQNFTDGPSSKLSQDLTATGLSKALTIAPGDVTWDNLCDNDASNVFFESLPADHPVYILFTSGTTGPPKCIAQGVGVTVNHLKETILHCDLTNEDTCFIYTSLSWMLWHWNASLLSLGASLVLYDGSPFANDNPVAMLDSIVRPLKVSYFGCSARLLDEIKRSEKFCAEGLGKLRFVTSTGSALSPTTASFFANGLPQTRLASISGGTEINGCLAITSPLLPTLPGVIDGPPLGLDVDVIDPDSGARQKDNQFGELACFNPFPSMPLYFLNDPKGERFFKSYFSRVGGVWVHGDWACRHPGGGISIIGRSDATLNPGGVRVGTRDYYAVVEGKCGVRDSVVVGVRDPRGNEKVALFVVLEEGLTLTPTTIKEIKQLIKQHLSPKHVPAFVAQVEDIPVNLNMKKMEVLVRQLVNGEREDSPTPLSNPHSIQQYVLWRKNW
eukprot:CAMPEP_0174249810 /NCGR_PEP_ID=MMETSP0439-20130205/143_1 /TAXON_ID=0 /ORGANISM="Stereomyxa ramosa, Strain Chinc5" /LENGTH=1094 /DNA_ID=CAMNT_0015329719 /DNA_START=37 /DNA_END=3318 /DNA_ORIENTATION=+